jgi:hypothetical protein
MTLAQARRIALALPQANEEPHFQSTSFRIRGKIFATAPPGDEYLHVFVHEDEREAALTMYPEFVEKLFWGGKVAGLRVVLSRADMDVVTRLLRQAWSRKAPKALLGAAQPGATKRK